jgi:hypothetical protein
MKLFRTKVWSWLDIGLLKWSVLLFGMVAGAYFADFVRQFVWIFLGAAIFLAIRPSLNYFSGEG